MTTTTEQLESVTEKIKKILRLAEGGTEHEANVAMAKAQKMASEYAINLSMLNAWDIQEKEEYIEGTLIDKGDSRLPITFNYICWILQGHFNVKLIMFGTRSSGRRVTMIGEKKDIEIAGYVWDYLNITFRELWAKHKKENNLKANLRSSYFYGLYRGLNKKLRESKREADEEIFNDLKSTKTYQEIQQAKDNYALVCINKKKKIDEKVRELYPRLRSTSSSIRAKDADTINAGRRDGANISLNRAVTNSKSRQLAY